MEQTLSKAAFNGKEEATREILREYKGIDVNWKDNHGRTALHYACDEGHDKIVTLLLAHPDIDVNQKDPFRRSPFLLACWNKKNACVQLLLKDVRVKINEPDEGDHTPLWSIAWSGYIELIKFLIASGREIDLGQAGNRKNDAIGVAEKSGRTEVISLLKKFRCNPGETRREVRRELGWLGEEEAKIFALVIFLCDGLLEIKGKNTSEAARFFRVIERLPMELQIVLCCRVVGSMRMNISGEQREDAFKNLAKELELNKLLS